MLWIEDLQDDHPIVWRLLWIGAAMLGLFFGFLALPDTDFFRAVGITTAQHRVITAEHALYWSTRAALHKSASAPGQVTVIYATLLGVDATGRVLVSVPVGDHFEQRAYGVADVDIRDTHGAAAIVAKHQFADIRLELYSAHQAVIWLDARPLNLMFIEAGVAAADPTPPTNIVDSAFAAYYWQQTRESPHAIL